MHVLAMMEGCMEMEKALMDENEDVFRFLDMDENNYRV